MTAARLTGFIHVIIHSLMIWNILDEYALPVTSTGGWMVSLMWLSTFFPAHPTFSHLFFLFSLYYMYINIVCHLLTWLNIHENTAMAKGVHSLTVATTDLDDG